MTVVARDPERGLILLDGLGFAGVGRMWLAECESHRAARNYDAAPLVRAPEDLWRDAR